MPQKLDSIVRSQVEGTFPDLGTIPEPENQEAFKEYVANLRARGEMMHADMVENGVHVVNEEDVQERQARIASRRDRRNRAVRSIVTEQDEEGSATAKKRIAIAVVTGLLVLGVASIAMMSATQKRQEAASIAQTQDPTDEIPAAPSDLVAGPVDTGDGLDITDGGDEIPPAPVDPLTPSGTGPDSTSATPPVPELDPVSPPAPTPDLLLTPGPTPSASTPQPPALDPVPTVPTVPTVSSPVRSLPTVPSVDAPSGTSTARRTTVTPPIVTRRVDPVPSPVTSVPRAPSPVASAPTVGAAPIRIEVPVVRSPSVASSGVPQASSVGAAPVQSSSSRTSTPVETAPAVGGNGARQAVRQTAPETSGASSSSSRLAYTPRAAPTVPGAGAATAPGLPGVGGDASPGGTTSSGGSAAVSRGPVTLGAGSQPSVSAGPGSARIVPPGRDIPQNSSSRVQLRSQVAAASGSVASDGASPSGQDVLNAVRSQLGDVSAGTAATPASSNGGLQGGSRIFRRESAPVVSAPAPMSAPASEASSESAAPTLPPAPMSRYRTGQAVPVTLSYDVVATTSASAAGLGLPGGSTGSPVFMTSSDGAMFVGRAQLQGDRMMVTIDRLIVEGAVQQVKGTLIGPDGAPGYPVNVSKDTAAQIASTAMNIGSRAVDAALGSLETYVKQLTAADSIVSYRPDGTVQAVTTQNQRPDLLTTVIGSLASGFRTQNAPTSQSSSALVSTARVSAGQKALIIFDVD